MRRQARILTRCGSYFQRCWFAYRGEVGTSSPVCIRCSKPNPNYSPDRDTHREDAS